jgi:diacylglycerol kinase (ATP)
VGRFKIIVNPVSGRGAGSAAVPVVEGLLRDHGVDYSLTRTEHPWHAAELAKQAATEGFEVVVAVGGDGTANEVLNGLMLARQTGAATEPAMGILCVGRGNDFAFGMGAPRPLAEGCRALASGGRRTVDVGRVTGGLYPQGRYFGNGIGVGFDAVVGFVALKMTRLSGFPSYIVAALKTMYLYYQAPLVRIEFDGQTSIRRLLMVSVMNGRRMGGGFMMAPTAEADDGLLDLCLAEQVSRARMFVLIYHFMRGTQAGKNAITTAQARRVVVTALEGTLPAHADGETLCEDGRELVVEVLPRQLQFVCPA